MCAAARDVDDTLHLAYITTGYPYASHTFIQIEVLALREMGVEVSTYVLWRSPTSEIRTEADREAYATTYSMRPPRPLHYAAAHARAASTRFAEYRTTFKQTLARGGQGPSDIVRHFAYFVQGVVLWDRCRRTGVRHIHAHFANVASDVAMVACALSRGAMSWSFTMHGPTEFYNVNHFRLADKALAARFVVCISHFARSQLMALTDIEHWDKFKIVRSGINTSTFSPSPRAPGRQRLTILCVARLAPEKGQALLIRAAARILEQGHELAVVLAGDGPEREQLERLIRDLGLSDTVRLLGAVGHTTVQELIADADVFCLPSFAEGIPMTLMEAMAAEVPVISSRITGIPELIEHGHNGLLVTPGDLDDLEAALLRVIHEPDAAAEMAKAGRERVCSSHDLFKNTRQLHELFEQFVGSA